MEHPKVFVGVFAAPAISNRETISAYYGLLMYTLLLKNPLSMEDYLDGTMAIWLARLTTLA